MIQSPVAQDSAVPYKYCSTSVGKSSHHLGFGTFQCSGVGVGGSCKDFPPRPPKGRRVGAPLVSMTEEQTNITAAATKPATTAPATAAPVPAPAATSAAATTTAAATAAAAAAAVVAPLLLYCRRQPPAGECGAGQRVAAIRPPAGPIVQLPLSI